MTVSSCFVGFLIMILDIINEPSRVGKHSRPSISVLLFAALTDMAERDLKFVRLSNSTILGQLEFVFFFPLFYFFSSLLFFFFPCGLSASLSSPAFAMVCCRP